MKKDICSKCKEELGDNHPNPLWCLMGEVYYLKREVSALKESVSSWKNAWYEVRDILGKLWWNHPAILSDKSLTYYRNAQKRKHESST